MPSECNKLKYEGIEIELSTSVQHLHEPSFFLTKTRGDALQLKLSLIKALKNTTLTWLSISAFWLCGYLYALNKQVYYMLVWFYDHTFLDAID